MDHSFHKLNDYVLFFGGEPRWEKHLWPTWDEWKSLFIKHGEIHDSIFNWMFEHIFLKEPPYIVCQYHVVQNWGVQTLEMFLKEFVGKLES
jgi:hypothetical protein